MNLLTAEQYEGLPNDQPLNVNDHGIPPAGQCIYLEVENTWRRFMCFSLPRAEGMAWINEEITQGFHLEDVPVYRKAFPL